MVNGSFSHVYLSSTFTQQTSQFHSCLYLFFMFFSEILKQLKQKGTDRSPQDYHDVYFLIYHEIHTQEYLLQSELNLVVYV